VANYTENKEGAEVCRLQDFGIKLFKTEGGDLMEQKNTNKMDKEPIRGLIYGASGTGKTTVAATMPSPGFVDTDKGMLSLKGKDIPYFDISQDVPVMRWLNINKAVDTFAKDPTIKTIVLDSLTTASECAMTSVQVTNKTFGKAPTLQDWGHQIAKLKELIFKLIALPKHIIVIAHEKYDKDELSGRVWCGPLVTGKLAQQLGIYFDEMYRAEVTAGKIQEFKLLMRATSVYTAKSRLAGKNHNGNYYPANFKEIIK